MQKLFIILSLVIFFLTIQLVKCAEDEFAEFDDINPVQARHQQEPDRDQNKPKVHVSQSDEPPPNKPAKGAIKEKEEAEVVSDILTEKSDEKKPQLNLVNAPLPRVYRLESYFIEAIFLLTCFLYAINYFMGSNTNKNLAINWFEHSRETLRQQFALIGGSPQIQEGSKKDSDDTTALAQKKQKGLIKSTDSVYYLWNSGRVGVDGLLVEMCLLKRQDLFSMALNLLKNDRDIVYLRFLLSNEGYENFVFCLANKSQAPKLARELIDVNSFCPKRKPLSQYGFEESRLVVMSELNDVATFLFDQKTGSFLTKYSRSINYIHITDQFATVREEVSTAQMLANPKRMATFCFNIPTSASDKTELLTFSLGVLDRLRRFKLARDSKQKSDKNRQRISDILQKTAFPQRQEAAQAKREEQRRQEKERIYNEDDPEKQRRWEKKEAKRELKKSRMRVKQLKVKSL